MPAASPCTTREISSTQKLGATAPSTLASPTPIIDRANAERTSAPSAHRPTGMAMAAIGSA